MRPLEIALIAALAAATVWQLVGERGTARHRIVGSAAIGVAVLQIAVEGYRWQLFPAYGLGTLFGWFAWRSRRGTRSVLGMAGWPAGLALVVALPVLLPVPRLPVPDGPFPVGTAMLVLEDPSRTEIYGPEPGGLRTIPLHIWYPAAAGDESAPGWLPPEVNRVVATEFGLPGFFLDHLRLTETHAVPDAPPAAGSDRFPVVIYSHGWTGFGRISPDQPEALASRGYVVIAPDHTYGALVAHLPSGPVAYDARALPDEDEVGEDAYQRASRALVAVFAADLRLVLDRLPTIDSPPGLAGRLDLGRIGIYGHSTGGGAAVAACHGDTRCGAVLGLDPWVEPVDDTVIADGLTQPFLAMRSDGWVDGPNDRRLRELHASGSGLSSLLALEGAHHYDFVALSQISPLSGALGFKGPIPGARAQDIIGETLVSFFDRHLRGAAAGAPSFPELRVDAERR